MKKALITVLVVVSACHRTPRSFGPDPSRTEAECAAVVAKVLADTATMKGPKVGNLDLVIPGIPPEKIHGKTARVWVQVFMTYTF